MTAQSQPEIVCSRLLKPVVNILKFMHSFTPLATTK